MHAFAVIMVIVAGSGKNRKVLMARKRGSPRWSFPSELGVGGEYPQETFHRGLLEEFRGLRTYRAGILAREAGNDGFVRVWMISRVLPSAALIVEGEELAEAEWVSFPAAVKRYIADNRTAGWILPSTVRKFLESPSPFAKVRAA